ncbi:MAG: LamG domain-containing protein [Nanoarchaeota archaeon]|nr:LamG domain-containing protein [Nanoarchaeota archaeon]
MRTWGLLALLLGLIILGTQGSSQQGFDISIDPVSPSVGSPFIITIHGSPETTFDLSIFSSQENLVFPSAPQPWETDLGGSYNILVPGIDDEGSYEIRLSAAGTLYTKSFTLGDSVSEEENPHVPKVTTTRDAQSEITCVGNDCTGRFYSAPRFYEENGEWIPLNFSFGTTNCLAGYTYCQPVNNYYKAHVKPIFSEDNIALTTNNRTFSMTLKSVGSPTAPLHAVVPQINDNQVLYKNITPFVDLLYTYQIDTFKETIVINDPSIFETIPEKDVLITFTLKGSESSPFLLLQPFALDGNDSVLFPTQTQTPAGTETVTYTMRFPRSWFTDPQRIYPILIDPSVTINNGNITSDLRIYKNMGSIPPLYIRTDDAYLAVGRQQIKQGFFYWTYMHRSVVEFNVTGIPRGANITEINLTLWHKQTGNAANQDFTVMEIEGESSTYPSQNPTCQGNCLYWGDMGNGSVYNTTQDYNGGIGISYTIMINQNATDNLTERRYSQGEDWFGFGLYSQGGEADSTSLTSEKQWYSTGNANDTLHPSMDVSWTQIDPDIALIDPQNGASFSFIKETMNLSFDFTDNENELQWIEVFASNETTEPLGESLVFLARNVSKDSRLNYSYTAPLWKKDPYTTLLLHFDNRTAYAENDTLVYDFSGSGNNATPSPGSAAFQPTFNHSAGKFAGSFEFDGTDDNLTLGDADSLTGLPATYMFWIKLFEGDTQNHGILEKLSGSTGIAIRQELGTFTVYVDSATALHSIPRFLPSVDTWYHVAVVINTTGGISVYRDGIFNSSGSAAAMTDNNADFVIGGAGTNRLNGTIDELVILNRTLSSAEIRDAARLPSGVYHWFVNATDFLQPNKSAVYTFTINVTPEVTIGGIDNGSIFSSIGKIIPGAFGDDDQKENISVSFYGGRSATPDTHDLLWRQTVTNGTNVTFNWSVPLTLNDSSTIFLYHFDNRSDLGEDHNEQTKTTSRIYDFTYHNLNGSGEMLTFNHTGGVLGGGFMLNSTTGASAPRIRVGGAGAETQLDFGTNDNFTMMAWIKLSGSQGVDGIVYARFNLYANQGYAFGYDDATGRILCTTVITSNNTVVNGITPINDSAWHLIACTRNISGSGAIIRVYLDGVLDGENTSATMADVSSTGQGYIGTLSVYGMYLNSGNGTLDEVSLWNRTLTQQEIRNHYRLNSGHWYWHANTTDWNESSQDKSEVREFTIAPAMNVNLTFPQIDPVTVVLNTTFRVNATILCGGGDCDAVTGALRYNNSISLPDTNISTTFADIPFHTAESNPQLCGLNPLPELVQCNLTWLVNATGDVGSNYEIGAMLNSNLSDVPDNFTENITVNIVSCILSTSLGFSTIEFDNTSVGTITNATGNNQTLYNLTIEDTTTCDTNILINATNVVHTTIADYVITPANITFNNVSNDLATGTNLSLVSTIVNTSVAVGYNQTMYFWFTTPLGMLAGEYEGTVNIITEEA